jgi:protein-disulfide isomerase
MTFTRRNTLTAMVLTAAITVFGAPLMAETAPAAKADDIHDYSIGSPDAKVHMIEYASFTCSHCADFHAQVWPQLKRDYIDTGKVRFTLREVYFDRFGLWAGMMARCGGEMRYFGIVDILYDTQREWAAASDPNEVVASLKKIGRSAGMDDAKLDICMQDGARAEALLAHYQKSAEADKIQGTPSFIINDTLHSNMSYDDMKKILDTELEKAVAE